MNFKKSYEREDFKEVVKSVSLDLWVCNHFKVLPTDDRFERLTDNQKALLLFGYLENSTSDELREAYIAERYSRNIVTEQDEKNFERLGYTREQIMRIKSQMEKAKLNG